MSGSRVVHVLRLGHRLVRDDRTTTHVCLVARVFGAEKIYIFNGDPGIKKKVDDVCRRWGGDFEVEITEDWRRVLKEWRSRQGIIVHLTMYGLELDAVIDDVRRTAGDVLVVVGAEKVPREVFEMSDFNIAVGNQPHSEIAALAVFLDRFFRGEELKRRYLHAKYRVVPTGKGKRVEKIL